MNPLTVLRDAFHFFSRHLPSIAPLCLPLIAAECLARAVVAGLVDTDHSPAYELLVGLFFYPLYSAALILYLDTRSNGQEIAKRDLFALLDAPANAGMGLTESCAMTPAASVSGFYIGHPEARYFAIPKIGRDQLEDWAGRKGMAVAEAERWLAPLL